MKCNCHYVNYGGWFHGESRIYHCRLFSMNDSFLKELVRPYYLRYFYFPLAHSNRPASFRQCWKYPWQSLSSVSHLDSPTGTGRDIVIFPMADWHGPMQRSQHLALGFAQSGHRCIYQNPHLGREYPSPFPFSGEPRFSRLQTLIYEMHVHLPREPVYHHRPLLPAEVDRVATAYLELFRRHGAANPLFFVSFPLWAPVALRLKKELGGSVIYDCHDYFPEFPGVAPKLAADEFALFEHADEVIFSSSWLHAKWLGEFPSLAGHIVRNAVTPGDFAAGNPLPPDHGNGSVTIGYVGAMASWFDVELVDYLVRSRPEWQFVFVGEVASREVRRIARHSNTHFTGVVPYQAIPQYLNQFSAAIIPFRISPLTLAVDPVKLYEYLSSSLPVVSTPLPEVDRFGDVISVATSPAEFLNALDSAIHGDTADIRKRRRDSVFEETWSRRASDILSVAFPTNS